MKSPLTASSQNKRKDVVYTLYYDAFLDMAYAYATEGHGTQGREANVATTNIK